MKLFVAVASLSISAYAAQADPMPWQIRGPFECVCCPIPEDLRNLQGGTTERANEFPVNCGGRQRDRQRDCNGEQGPGTGGGGRGFRGGRGEGLDGGGGGQFRGGRGEGHGKGGGRGRGGKGFRGGQGWGQGRGSGGGWTQLSDEERLDHHYKMCALMDEEGLFDCDREDFDFYKNCTVIEDTSTTPEP